MKEDKRKRLEAAGWTVGRAVEFLALDDDEAALIERKLELSDADEPRGRGARPREVIEMRTLDDLSHRGFRLATRLSWKETDDDIRFEFADWTPHGRTEPVIYAYVDTANDRLLNIGQTGGSFRKRSSGYKRWINGEDKRRNAPINGAWLNCLLGECTPSKVEIWVKKSSVDEHERRIEESSLIRTLKPVLNTKA